MVCPECQTTMAAAPISAPARGMLCGNQQCPLSKSCETCGKGWRAIEVAPQSKDQGMRRLQRPGNVFAECADGHYRLLRTAPLDEGWIQDAPG